MRGLTQQILNRFQHIIGADQRFGKADLKTDRGRGRMGGNGAGDIAQHLTQAHDRCSTEAGGERRHRALRQIADPPQPGAVQRGQCLVRQIERGNRKGTNIVRFTAMAGQRARGMGIGGQSMACAA